VRTTPILEKAEPLGGYFVRVTYADGLAAEVDLGYLVDLGPVFEALRDPAYFRRLRASRAANTITWPNGADIAPETLYAAAQASAHAVAP
jgi:hypothetical protein